MRLFLLTTLTMFAFAANSVLNRLALIAGGLDPASFALIRLGSGGLVLAVLVLSRGRRRGGGLGARALLLRPRGALALAVYVLGFSFAYVTLGAGVGALILFGVVQITMFLGAVLSREALPARRWLGAAVAFGGLVWLLWPTSRVAPEPMGALLMGAAGLGWGIYSLIGRCERDALGATAANFLWATPLALAVFLLVPHTGFGRAGVVYALASGIVTSGLGYALWYAVLPRLAASLAAVAQLSVPVIAMAGGMLALGEAPSLRFAVASVLVLGGVALSLPRRR